MENQSNGSGLAGRGLRLSHGQIIPLETETWLAGLRFLSSMEQLHPMESENLAAGFQDVWGKNNYWGAAKLDAETSRLVPLDKTHPLEFGIGCGHPGLTRCVKPTTQAPLEA